MCTIGIVFRAHPQWPLVIAANRDELYARDTMPPTVLERTAPTGPIVGGRDLVAGGTWMGVNGAGMFVGITNQRTYVGPDPSLRSRGEVVMQALRCASMAELRRFLESLDARTFNAFNLLFGDGDSLEVAYARQEQQRVRIEAVPEGAHALPNDTLDHPDFAKAGWLSTGLAAALASSSLDPEPIRAVLGSHRKPALADTPNPPPNSRFDRSMIREVGALCIHTERYGTRSSTIVALAGGRVVRYLYADGPPCQTPFVDSSHLLS